MPQNPDTIDSLYEELGGSDDGDTIDSLYDTLNAGQAKGPRPLRSGNKYDFDKDMIGSVRKIAEEEGQDPDFVEAMMHQESGGNRKALSNKGARGVLQVMPGTGKRFGANQDDLWDPEVNTRVSMRYLDFLSKRFKGDKELILAGYNAGEGSVDKHGKNWKRYARETRDYVPAIMGKYGRIQKDRELNQLIKDLDEYTGTKEPQSIDDIWEELNAEKTSGQFKFQTDPEHTVTQETPTPEVPQAAPLGFQDTTTGKVAGAGKGFILDSPIENGYDPNRVITPQDYETFKVNNIARQLNTTPQIVSQFMKERGITTGSPFRPGQPLSQEDINEYRQKKGYAGILPSALDDAQLNALKAYIGQKQAKPEAYQAPDLVSDYASKMIAGGLEAASEYDPTGAIQNLGLDLDYGKEQGPAPTSGDLGEDAMYELKNLLSVHNLSKIAADMIPILATGGLAGELALGSELTSLGLGAAETNRAIALARKAIAEAADKGIKLTADAAMEQAMKQGVAKVANSPINDLVTGAVTGAARNPQPGQDRITGAAQGMFDFGGLAAARPGLTGKIGQGLAMTAGPLIRQAATGEKIDLGGTASNFLMGLFMPFHGEKAEAKPVEAKSSETPAATPNVHPGLADYISRATPEQLNKLRADLRYGQHVGDNVDPARAAATIKLIEDRLAQDKPQAGVEPPPPDAVVAKVPEVAPGVEGAKGIEDWVAQSTPEDARNAKAMLEAEIAKGNVNPRAEYALQLLNDRIAAEQTGGQQLPPLDLQMFGNGILDYPQEMPPVPPDPMWDAINNKVAEIEAAKNAKRQRLTASPQEEYDLNWNEPQPTSKTALFGPKMTPNTAVMVGAQPMSGTAAYDVDFGAGDPLSTAAHKRMAHEADMEQLRANIAAAEAKLPPKQVSAGESPWPSASEGPETMNRIAQAKAQQPAKTAARIEADVAALPVEQLQAVRDQIAPYAETNPEAAYMQQLIDERIAGSSQPGGQGGKFPMAEEKAKPIKGKGKGKAAAPVKTAQRIEQDIAAMSPEELTTARKNLTSVAGDPYVDYQLALIDQRLAEQSPPKEPAAPKPSVQKPQAKRKLSIPPEIGGSKEGYYNVEQDVPTGEPPPAPPSQPPTGETPPPLDEPGRGKYREYTVPKSTQVALDEAGISHELPRDVYEIVPDEAAFEKALSGEKYGINVDPEKAKEIALGDEFEARKRGVTPVVQAATSIKLIEMEVAKQRALPEGERDWGELHRYLDALKVRAKNHGQAIQILKWLSRVTPEGMYAYMERQQEKIRQAEAERNPKKAAKAEQLQKDLEDAIDQVHGEAAEEVANRIAREMGAPPIDKSNIKFKWKSYTERMNARKHRAYAKFKIRSGEEGALGSKLFAPGSPMESIVDYATTLVHEHGTADKEAIIKGLREKFTGAVGKRYIDPYMNKIVDRAISQYAKEVRKLDITPEMLVKPAKDIAKMLKQRVSGKPPKPPTMERLAVEVVHGVVSDLLQDVPRTPRDYLDAIRRVAENFPHPDALWDSVIEKLEKTKNQDPNTVAQALKFARKMKAQGGLPKLASDSRFIQGVNQFLASRGEKLNDLVAEHYTDVKATKDALIERLLKDAFMSPDEARQMADHLEQQFDDIAAKLKKKKLEPILKKHKAAKASFPERLGRVVNLADMMPVDEQLNAVQTFIDKPNNVSAEVNRFLKDNSTVMKDFVRTRVSNISKAKKNLINKIQSQMKLDAQQAKMVVDEISRKFDEHLFAKQEKALKKETEAGKKPGTPRTLAERLQSIVNLSESVRPKELDKSIDRFLVNRSHVFTDAVRGYLKKNNTKLRDLIRSTPEELEAKKLAFNTDLAKQLNLKPQEVDTVRDKIFSELDTFLQGEQDKALLKETLPRDKKSYKKPTTIDKLIEVTNLSAKKTPEQRAAAIAAYAQNAIGLPAMTQELASDIITYSEVLQKLRQQSEAAKAAGNTKEYRQYEQKSNEIMAHMMKAISSGQTMTTGQAIGHGLRTSVMMNPATISYAALRDTSFPAFELARNMFTSPLTGGGKVPVKAVLSDFGRATWQSMKDSYHGIDTSSMYGEPGERMPQPEFKSKFMRGVQITHDWIFKSLQTGAYEAAKNERSRQIAKQAGKDISKLTGKELEEAHNYALEVALQDTNFVNETLGSIRRGLNLSYQDRAGKLHGLPFFIGDLVILFNKAPGSSMLRSGELMGGGVGRALYHLAKMKNMTDLADQAQAKRAIADGLSRAAIGVAGLGALGFLLGKMGAVIQQPDDARARRLGKQAGISGTMINLSQIKRYLAGQGAGDGLPQEDDELVSLTNLDPLSSPFLLGTGIGASGKAKDKTALALEGLWSGVNNAVTDNQTLRSLSNLAVDPFREGEQPTDRLQQIGNQGVKLLVPSFVRALNRFVLGRKEADPNVGGDGPLDQLVNNFLVELPGISGTYPTRQGIGGESARAQGSITENIIPGRFSQYKPTEMEDFYLRYFARASALEGTEKRTAMTAMAGFAPKYADDGTKLTGDQRRQYAELIGRQMTELAHTANTSSTFKKLPIQAQGQMLGYYMGQLRRQADILVLGETKQSGTKLVDKKIPTDPLLFEHNSQVEFARSAVEKQIAENPLLAKTFNSLEPNKRREVLDRIKGVYTQALLPEVRGESTRMRDARISIAEHLLPMLSREAQFVLRIVELEEKLPASTKQMLKDVEQKRFGAR